MSDSSTARIHVRVTPRAVRDEIVARIGGDLLIRVTAPPDGGRANEAVCRLVAKSIGVPKSALDVVRGHTARHKAIDIAGVSQREADIWLEGFPER